MSDSLNCACVSDSSIGAEPEVLRWRVHLLSTAAGNGARRDGLRGPHEPRGLRQPGCAVVGPC